MNLLFISVGGEQGHHQLFGGDKEVSLHEEGDQGGRVPGEGGAHALDVGAREKN